MKAYMPAFCWFGTGVSRQFVPKGKHSIALHHYATATRVPTEHFGYFNGEEEAKSNGDW
jgi:hypothetical protein